VFTGCSDPDPDPDPGPDWGKQASWDGADTTTVLGTAVKDINADNIRYKETELGNLIADGIVEYARFTSGKSVDFAMLNGQNVQGFAATGISAGDITLPSLSSGNALGDTLFLVTYTGANIEAIINIFVNSNAYENTGDGWRRNCVVLVSKGVRYTITPDADPNKPPHATGIKVNGTAIEATKEYRVAVGNFMAGQSATNDPDDEDGWADATSGGPSNFTSYGTEKTPYADNTLKQAVAKYILAQGTINPVTEGRIIGKVPVKLPAE
jgi:2',3'-cyclic-nucleotide 2'-phosphodiesterase (5'-nucleotidase family)